MVVLVVHAVELLASGVWPARWQQGRMEDWSLCLAARQKQIRLVQAASARPGGASAGVAARQGKPEEPGKWGLLTEAAPPLA